MCALRAHIVTVMNREFDVPVDIRRMVGTSPYDAVVAALAEIQHGVVSRRQLRQLGLHASSIERRVASGRLPVLHRGVYAVGHRVLSREGRLTAAVLACGSGAVASHRSAAEHRGLRASTLTEITAPIARRSRPGIRLHVSRLADDEVEVHDGIPTTTVARTIFDLAGAVARHQLEAVLNEAEYRQLTSPTSIPELVQRHPGRRGAVALRHVLGLAAQRTRTIEEEEFLAFLDEHDLPRPQTSRSRTLRGHTIEADGVYEEARLIIEIDGGSHKTERRFHEDRERDRAHLVEGWNTIRVSRLSDQLAADIRALLPHA